MLSIMAAIWASILETIFTFLSCHTANEFIGSNETVSSFIMSRSDSPEHWKWIWFLVLKQRKIKYFKILYLQIEAYSEKASNGTQRSCDVFDGTRMVPFLWLVFTPPDKFVRISNC